MTRGQAAEAVTLLQSVVKEDPQSAQSHHFLGLALAQTNDLTQAKRELIEAVKLAPNSSEARNALAALYLAQGNVDLAIEEATTAVRQNGRNLKGAIILGDAYYRKGNIARAKQTFDAIVKAVPKEAYSRYRLGLIAKSENRLDAAISEFESSLVSNPSFIEPLNQIASVMQAQGRAEEARARVQRQIDASPKNPLLHNLKGTLWMAARDLINAEAEFKMAIELNSEVTAPYLNLAELYFRTNQIDEAIKEYEAALAKNPKLLSAYALLGMIHEQRKEYDKAKSRYQEALKLNAKFAPAANNLAWILSENGGNVDEALGYAQMAKEQQPDDPHIADTLGWLYYKKNVYLRSVTLLKEAAEKLPDNPVVLYHYGMAQYRNGDKTSAKKTLETSLKLNTNYTGAADARAVLKQL
jgi:tetratricopeptide (TPR) repeat protein